MYKILKSKSFKNMLNTVRKFLRNTNLFSNVQIYPKKKKMSVISTISTFLHIITIQPVSLALNRLHLKDIN